MHVRVNGVRLFFDVEGAKLVPDGPVMREKPTLLMLHGGPGSDHSIYRPAYSALADVAQIVYLDHRGNGRSEDGPRESWKLAQWGDDVAGFCDALGIVSPIVLGASFGGMVALAYATIGVVTLPVMSLVAGTAAFGWHPLRLPGTGVELATGPALGRLAIVLGFVLISELVVAALAFLLSVLTDSPLGAVGGAVGLVIVSNILDAVTALGSWRELLPTHWQFAWLDALQSQVSWVGMIQGSAISVSYALVLFALAFRRFRAKDIVS